MKPDLCIYHAPCQDGFTAAWAIWQRWPDVEFVEGVYGQAPPDVTGKRVLLVDFSYKRPVLEALAGRAVGITILDHHKSAEADLADFIGSPTDAHGGLDPFERLADAANFMGRLPIQAKFDMEKSGARLAWEYANPAAMTPPPAIVRHVEDRDLWRFALPGTREIAANLFSRRYEFEGWSKFAAELEDDAGRRALVREGEAIERKHHKDIAELLRLTRREMVIGGVRVPVANLPYTLSSDGANLLAEGRAFAACYYDNAEGRRVFSLRSKEGGADVSLIAAAYGGGGHKHAAGFSVERGWEGEVAS